MVYINIKGKLYIELFYWIFINCFSFFKKYCTECSIFGVRKYTWYFCLNKDAPYSHKRLILVVSSKLVCNTIFLFCLYWEINCHDKNMKWSYWSLSFDQTKVDQLECISLGQLVYFSADVRNTYMMISLSHNIICFFRHHVLEKWRWYISLSTTCICI
jgi:hypothetical protein